VKLLLHWPAQTLCWCVILEAGAQNHQVRTPRQQTGYAKNTLENMCAAALLPPCLQFCRLNAPPQSFPASMAPTWRLNPSYYHYRGCHCLTHFHASWRRRVQHGDTFINVLECSPAPSSLGPAAAAGLSVAVCVVGICLAAYCTYVAWYGRWGLPKLQRVSRAPSLQDRLPACCCCGNAQRADNAVPCAVPCAVLCAVVR
jgi:hypothetical protein